MMVRGVLHSAGSGVEYLSHLRKVVETAKVIYGEARGKDVTDTERIWIGHVVKNREMMKNQFHFGSIREDFEGYKQFERAWESGKISNNPLREKAWLNCIKIATKVWHSKKDPTGGAVFFVGLDKAASSRLDGIKRW